MAIPVTSKMKPDIQAFFTDPGELEKQHNKTLLQVIDFQRNHRQRYFAHLQKKVSSAASSGRAGGAGAMEQQFAMLKEEAEKRIQRLMQENAQLKQMVEGGRRSFAQATGTPSPHHSWNIPSPRSQQTPSTPGTQLPSGSLPSARPRIPSAGAPATTPASKTPTQLTPTGPSRISVRTPPTNGRIGPLAGSQTDRYANARKTPEAQSPMDTSPLAKAKGRVTPGIPMLVTPQTQASFGQSRTVSPLQLDPNKRQIHLRYQPRSATWQKSLTAYTPSPSHNS